MRIAYTNENIPENQISTISSKINPVVAETSITSTDGTELKAE